ncbi:hypothetical protein HPB52_024389 [Rhipicephalus sanguineus]|uniref:Neurotransmitter-gated ion-channel transmembrane domain-containing protein n=3 Tax=Rhipicephalus sanguineus TaxID=34632 RepID=A0A9D4TCG6_RHISA|nr:hypothetical protein HPB52_024389 [Rhipicephalus sanguineus]
MELSWPFYAMPCASAFRFLRGLRHVRFEDGGLRAVASPITFATYRNLPAETRLPEAVVRETRLVHSASDNFDDKELTFIMDSSSDGQHCLTVYSVRQTTIIDCPMDFSNYPREIHECNISITTTLPENVTKFLWSEQNPVKVNPNVDLVRFEVTVQGQGQSSEHLRLQLRLARRMGDQLVGTYASTALLVVCSWPAFWLGTTERLSLCGTLLLALTQQSAAARRALSPSVALTPVDWWMSGCVALVLAVIVETTIACYEAKVEGPKLVPSPETSTFEVKDG